MSFTDLNRQVTAVLHTRTKRKVSRSRLRNTSNENRKERKVNTTSNSLAHASAGERERIVLGTDTGELLIVEGTELKATLQLDLGSTVHSIAAYAKVCN